MFDRKLITLYDMLKIRAWFFVEIGASLSHFEATIEAYSSSVNLDSPATPEMLEHVKLNIGERLRKLITGLEVPLTSKKIDELISSISERKVTFRELQNAHRDIRSRFTDELQGKICYKLTDSEAKKIMDTEPFGAEVKSLFKEEHRDIMVATSCIALGHPTASVFHLTRAIEQLTRRFGRKLRVTVLDTKGRRVAIKDAFWKDILIAVEKQIKAQRNPTTRLSPKKKKQLDRYEDIALRLEYIKNAWRNPVSHGEFFQQSEAENIYELTRIFAQHLAKLLVVKSQ